MYKFSVDCNFVTKKEEGFVGCVFCCEAWFVNQSEEEITVLQAL
jgi:hypothetical protein